MLERPIYLGTIRGTDSNSLLRWYDLAAEVARSTTSQLDRAKAEKAMRSIAQELQKRRVKL